MVQNKYELPDELQKNRTTRPEVLLRREQWIWIM